MRRMKSKLALILALAAFLGLAALGSATAAAPLKTVTESNLPALSAGQVELAGERRGGRERVEAGTVVVDETRHGQLAGPHPTTDPVGGLDHGHGDAGGRQGEGGCETVRATADDDGAAHVLHSNTREGVRAGERRNAGVRPCGPRGPAAGSGWTGRPRSAR